MRSDQTVQIFFIVRQKKYDDVSSECSARQRIHMKNQALLSLKDKSKKLKCRLLQFLFGALRVKNNTAASGIPLLTGFCHHSATVNMTETPLKRT